MSRESESGLLQSLAKRWKKISVMPDIPVKGLALEIIETVLPGRH